MNRIATALCFLYLTFYINVFSQINRYPYIETANLPVGWNVIQTTPIWSFGTATMNPAGKANDVAVVCNFFSYAAGPTGLITSPVFDFSALSHPVIHFYSTYTSYDFQDDSLQVLVSTDAGLNFTDVPIPYRKSFSSTPSLATVQTQHTQYNPAAQIQWRHETIDMTAYAGNSSVMFGFRGVCAYGNNLWLDNFIVNEANSIMQINIDTAGSYTYSSVTVSFNTIGFRNGLPQSMNSTGGLLSFVKYNNQIPVPTVATPNIAANLTAMSGDSTIFTPNKISPDVWYTVTYSGNDISGYANYDLKIDISSVTGIVNPDKLYIVKRADMTGSWICLNTERDSNFLITRGLNSFSDFAIAGDSLLNPLPVELVSFASDIEGRNVILRWNTDWEMNNSGFEIERSENKSNWKKAGFVKGKGNATTSEHYSFRDNNLKPGLYNYRIKQIDFNGNYEYFNLQSDVIVKNPETFELYQNYPNPFNPSTTISYNLSAPSIVKIEIFDMTGKIVAEPVNANQTAGFYSIKFNGSNLSSGIYFYKITADGGGNKFIQEKKMLLLK